MSPRLRMEEEGDRGELSAVMEKGGMDWVMDLGPMIIMSDLSQFSRR